jgi:dihydroxyacetone kinase-like protein
MALKKDILIGIIESISKRLIDSESILTELDSPIGDADCGVGIKRGFEAVLGVLGELKTLEPADMLLKTGFTLASTIGGTSGAMLGTGFIETGKSLSGSKDIEIKDIASALEHSLSVIKRRGGNTEVGDKTLVDALEPAIQSIRSSVDSGDYNMISILEKAVDAARQGSEKTVKLVARKGRASYLGDRSKGHKDPGSVYIVLMFEAALESLKSSPAM